MGFKADSSFLRFLSMGAIGVHQTIKQLRLRGFVPIELERYCGSNKIWATKVKRLRLPDLLCVKTGLRVEVRAKSDLKIRMSDAPENPDRVWDAGLRNEDLVAIISCFADDDGLKAADDAVYFSTEELRLSVDKSKLGPPKSASEGAERDRTWAATVPSRDGTVLEVTDKKLIVLMSADENRAERRQTYQLRGKSAYVEPGDSFAANATFLAGAPSCQANLSIYLENRYDPISDLQSDNDVDRYAAVKSLRYKNYSAQEIITSLDEMIQNEYEDRVRLEAAGSSAFFGSAFGQDEISRFIWENEERNDLRMEAVFILTELGDNSFTQDQLKRIAADIRFKDDEVQQAAVWALGKAGLKKYAELLQFIDNENENLALHAIAAFGEDTPNDVIDSLIRGLLSGDHRRAAACSEVLRIIASYDVLRGLISATEVAGRNNWILATLGRLPADIVRIELNGTELLNRIEPMLVSSSYSNWLASEAMGQDISFLLKQDLY